ncbi:MAG TPA: hypothetical protein VGC13_11560 [Longimicrobium sp.]|uniref:hypothetical protein n=1 Tax=Longimicrobium sp. TaxID=2029185 RepID=UPI002ED7F543
MAVAAPFVVPSALVRPDAERIAFTSGWAAAALLYAALAWSARRDGKVWLVQDVLTVVVFLLTALYEANWPGFRIWTVPAAVGGLWAASGLGSSLVAARRWQPSQSSAPSS